MKSRIMFLSLLLLYTVVRAQDFLEPSSWCGNDPELPLSDFTYRYDCWDGHPRQGILAWRNDTLFFAEFQHYEYIAMHQLRVPRNSVRLLEELTDAAIKTASHFHAEIMGLSLAELHDCCGNAAQLQSPLYGRSLELSHLLDSIIVCVMEGDTLGMSQLATKAYLLGCSFRRDYPFAYFRPYIGIGYNVPWNTDDAWDTRYAWVKPLIEQHDLFCSMMSNPCEPSMMLSGRYLKVCQPCDREVDSAMITRFALDRREEFVLLSRALCVSDFKPNPVEITISDTVTQRQCYIDEWHCRMLLPTSDNLSQVVAPSGGPGYYHGVSSSSWLPADERNFTPWWKF